MKIIIADDHELFRQGLCLLVQKIDSDALIIESNSHARTLELIDQNKDADLVLLDLAMPGGDGLKTLKNIFDSYPLIPVIIISASEQPENILSTIESGAMGYICKSENATVMKNAIEIVLSGTTYIPPILLNFSRRKPILTNKQIEVLKLLSKGEENKQIATSLDMALPTAKAHLREIFKILKVRNRIQAVLEAKKLGLL